FPPSAGAADPARLREAAAPARSAAQVRSSGPVDAEPFGAGEPVAAGLSGLGGSELARIATHLRRSRSGEPVRLDVSAVLEAVRDVAGVRDAAVREEPGGGPTLRLDLTEGADPRHVGQQVARLLGERLGVGADLAGGSPGGLEATVEVTLAYDGVRVIGRASGPAVDSHVLRLSAAATANAVEILLSGRGRCAVEYAALVPAGTVDTALVVLLLLAGGWAE